MKQYVVMCGSMMKDRIYVRPVEVHDTRAEAKKAMNALQAKKRKTDFWIHAIKKEVK